MAKPATPDPVPQPTDYVERLIEGWARERPDLDVTPIGIVNRVGRLAGYFATEVDAVFARAGITSTEFAIVANLRRVGTPYQLTQRELMDALRLTSGTISVRIDRLVEAGLVRREPDARDGRSVLVTLTTKGSELFDAVAPDHLANEANLLAALRPEERAELARMLRLLLIEFEQPGEDRPDERLGLHVAAAHVAQQRRAAVGLPPAAGLLVESVQAHSPAGDAGLVPGDLIVKAGTTPLRSLSCLARALEAAPDAITLTLRRGGQQLTRKLRLQPG